MNKFFVLVLSMNIISICFFGQSNYNLSGYVSDEKGNSLTGVAVFLDTVNKGVVTDNSGRFTISGLVKGLYILNISFVGFNTVRDTLIIEGDKIYNVRLKVAARNLQEVVITGNYSEMLKKEVSLPIETVNAEYLKQNLGGSLMKSLERLPGLTTIDIGQGQSKPVIRGLGFNRVVVVENNIKHEAQQWGSDHGLEIDQYAVDNIQVIKGPAALMYGSDAVGGVIDIKNRKLPAENTLGCNIDLSGKSNSGYLGSSVMLNGRKKWFYADFRATIINYGDYKVPADSIDIYSYRAALYRNNLRNTAGNEKNFHLSLGIIKSSFQSKLYFSSINLKSGFFANAHGLEPRNVDAGLHDKSNRDLNYPFQQVNHLKIVNTNRITQGDFTFETDLGFQRNYRQEWNQYVNHGYMPALFPDSLNFTSDLERLFEKYVYSGNVKLFYDKNDKTRYAFGLNSDYQDNGIGGRGFIIPAFQQINAGLYSFFKHTFSEKNIVQLGLRYDFGNVKTNEYYDWFTSPVVGNNADTTFQFLKRADALNLSFSNFSWSVGYNYNATEWSFKANIGKSFRMPIAKELAANGVNYHHFSYEIGDKNLLPEVSYQLDAGLEYSSGKVAAGASPFLNYFGNYIYLNPGYEHDRLYGNGNQIYYYTQSKVLRYGAELHAGYQVLKPLQLNIIGEYVYSEQLSGEKKGFTLPFSPPANVILNAVFRKPELLFLSDAYCSVDFMITAKQHNIVPPEETTAGSRIINIGLGGELNLNNQKINIALQIQNLINTKYFNHTSYYRLINVPEPGRNFIMNVSIPLTRKIN